jgi:hypothetical protein
MKLVLAIAALAAVAMANPTTDDYITPAMEMVQAQGENACKALADSDIKVVKDEVDTYQKVVDALSDGSECAAKGQGEVTRTKKALDAANSEKSSADSALASAQNANVDFPVYKYNSLKEGQCNGQFFSSSAYTTAEKRVNDAQARANEAKIAAEAALKAYNHAVKEAARLKQECLCTARDEYKKTWADVNKGVADNDAAWNKAHNILCVLDGKAKSCKVPATPVVKDNKPLIADAKNADCKGDVPDDGVVGNIVYYGGNAYRTLDNTNPKDSYNAGGSKCQGSYITMPAGWKVAPYSSGVLKNVVEKYPWRTHVLVFSNGDGYGTAAYSKGRWNPNMLKQSGSQYKPGSCSLRVLIVKK